MGGGGAGAGLNSDQSKKKKTHQFVCEPEFCCSHSYSPGKCCTPEHHRNITEFYFKRCLLISIFARRSSEISGIADIFVLLTICFNTSINICLQKIFLSKFGLLPVRMS